MIGRITSSLAMLALVAGAGAAQAQQTSTNRVAAETDWSVFVDGDPTACWAVSTFKESVNTRDGRVVAVRRGDILLFVSYIPSNGVDGQVSFTGGYPFAPGSTVEVQIDDQKFQLLTDANTNPEMAWAAEGDDAKLIAAMKRGSQAILTARSSRGTTTKDTFSLLGVTAAVDEAKKRCSG